MYTDKPFSFTDYYELTMAQGYFLSGKYKQRATFDYFFRRNPFDGGYTVFAGLSELIEVLQNFSVSESELSYLKNEGFNDDFLEYLNDFSFTGNLYAAREGEVVFPSEPIAIVEGNLIEAQIIETLLLNILNFQSLIATKASRMRTAAGDYATLLDFGLRRSQGLGGIHASRSAIIGGFDGTSNVYSAQEFGLNAGGTMAHSWVQSFESELDSFREYAKYYPDSTVLLVDTYNTLKSGIPNAIKVAKELEENGHKLQAVRLDSGDLSYLSKKSRKMLDDAGLDYVKIAASNQLDERVITSLINQNSPIDIYGVGTRLVTGDSSPALDGVYKLSSVDEKPKIKQSENIEKLTLPGFKTVRRYWNSNGTMHGDAVGLKKSDPFKKIHHPTFPIKETDLKELDSTQLLHQIITHGEVTASNPSIQEIADYHKTTKDKLPSEFKRFDNPHVYKVGITPKLMDLRDSLISESEFDS